MFFIREILDAADWDSLGADQQAAVRQYLADLKQGPADGEMDIEWQETGRSYYRHLHVLGQLEGFERDAYLERLRDDIAVCRVLWPGNFVVEGVAAKIGDAC